MGTRLGFFCDMPKRGAQGGRTRRVMILLDPKDPRRVPKPRELGTGGREAAVPVNVILRRAQPRAGYAAISAEKKSRGSAGDSNG